MGSLKVVAISDTHTLHDMVSLPDGDVLIHCGDATSIGSVKEVARFNEWFKKQTHKYKLFIPGNHDFLFQEDFGVAKQIMDSATILLDSEIVINGIRFWGSPWSPFFNDWAFGLQRGEDIKRKWDLIPDNTDVLITHGPALGLRDYLDHHFGHIGCDQLRLAIDRVKPKYHVCGHIHAGYGVEKYNNTIIVNSAVCNENYDAVNLPQIFEVQSNG